VWADPTWPNRAGYSIPCAFMLGSGGGERDGGNSLVAWERAAAVVVESSSVVRSVLLCVFPLSVLLFLLFPLFVVLLNCPYPDPPVSACFFPLSSAARRGEGRPHGAFCCWPQPNHNTTFYNLLKKTTKKIKLEFSFHCVGF